MPKNLKECLKKSMDNLDKKLKSKSMPKNMKKGKK